MWPHPVSAHPVSNPLQETWRVLSHLLQYNHKHIWALSFDLSSICDSNSSGPVHTVTCMYFIASFAACNVDGRPYNGTFSTIDGCQTCSCQVLHLSHSHTYGGCHDLMLVCTYYVFLIRVGIRRVLMCSGVLRRVRMVWSHRSAPAAEIVPAVTLRGRLF